MKKFIFLATFIILLHISSSQKITIATVGESCCIEYTGARRQKYNIETDKCDHYVAGIKVEEYDILCDRSLEKCRENDSDELGTCVMIRSPTATPIPINIPTNSSQNTTPAIDFNKLKEAIPSLAGPFQPGPATNVTGIISIVLPYLYVIAGLLLLFYLIAGGFHMMIAARDEKGLIEAKGKITNALVGFLLLFVSYWIVQIVEYILGIQIF